MRARVADMPADTRGKRASHHAWARAVAAATLLVTLALAPTAQARWYDLDDIAINSAYTLRQGDFVIGVFTPLQVGLADSLTLSIHPVLALVLTPNFALRLKLYDGPVVLTASVAYFQTFLSERDATTGGGFPGSVETGVTLTVPVAQRIALSTYVGGAIDFATIQEVTRVYRVPEDTSVPADFETSRTVETLDTQRLGQSAVYGLGLNWRINQRNLIALQYKAHIDLPSGEHEIPTTTLLYAFAWERARLGLGVAIGRIPFRTGDTELIDLPAYPVADLWFRF